MDKIFKNKSSADFLIIGHRGAADLAPENTIPSFNKAIELGIKCIEFDVQLSKDQKWIIMHDEDINRTTNSNGKVCDLQSKDIFKLDAGIWFDKKFTNTKIPCLVELLDYLSSKDIIINIELKPYLNSIDSYAKLFNKLLKQYEKLIPKLWISSFSLELLIALRQLNTDITIGYLTENKFLDPIANILKYKFNSLGCNIDCLTNKLLIKAKENNIPIYVFTINNKQIGIDLYNNGVNGIFTDNPELWIN